MARNFRVMVVILRRVRERSSATIDEIQLMRLKSLRVLGILACLGFLAFQGNWVGLLCCLFIIALMVLTADSGSDQQEPKEPIPPSQEAMAILDDVIGMTAAPRSDFSKSIPIMTLKDGAVVRTWKNLVGYDHVFLSDSQGNIIYGGFVGWIHCKGLQNAIAKIRRELA